MKNEKPIRVIPSKSKKHKTETRVFAREIHETFCMQSECRFRDKHAVQGVCHTTERFDGERDLQKWFALKSKQHADDRKYFRKLYAGKPQKYIEHLEAHYECAMLNWSITIEEMIDLRRNNAILKDRLAKKTS